RRRFRGETSWPVRVPPLCSAQIEKGNRTWFLTVEKLTASTAATCFQKTTYGSTAEINPRILVRRLFFFLFFFCVGWGNKGGTNNRH
ncbi:MAG: hypothetical protein K8R46_03530, partial [Pirellulales bacterium]|nr:hypothetical protein [Pirellulales bacterium]